MQPNPATPVFNLGELNPTFGPNQANAKIILYVMPVFILVGFVILFRIPVGGIVMVLIAGGCSGATVPNSERGPKYTKRVWQPLIGLASSDPSTGRMSPAYASSSATTSAPGNPPSGYILSI